MADTTLNQFVASGTNADRLLFTPVPPTPASGPDQGYFFYETDTGDTFSWDGSAWQPVGVGTSTGTVTHTAGALTSGKAVEGNGSADIKVSTLTATVVKAASGTLSAATAGTDYVAPIAIHGNLVNGRLTTQSGVPISTTDRTAQSTLYFTPFNGNQIALYTGAVWVVVTFSELSLTLTGLTTDKNYDVFVDYNSGTPQLVLSAAWSNDTTRTDALALQDGVFIKSGSTTLRWVGTIRTTGTTTTEDSGGGTTTNVGGKRFVWNYYNRVGRELNVIDTSAQWSYGTATVRQANANTGNKIEYVTGFAPTITQASLLVNATTNGSSGRTQKVGIGVDSITAFSGLVGLHYSSGGTITTMPAYYTGNPGLGYHYLAWLEYGGDGTSNFHGLESSLGQSGLTVTIQN